MVCKHGEVSRQPGESVQGGVGDILGSLGILGVLILVGWPSGGLVLAVATLQLAPVSELLFQ